MTFRLQHQRYRLPFRGTVRTAHGPWSEREGFLVRVEAEGGGVGFGEAAPVPGFGRETVALDFAVLAALGDTLDDVTLAQVPSECGAVRQALAAALADARGEKPALRHAALGVAALLPAGRAVLAEIGPKAEIGYRVFKWKVGVGEVAEELPLLDDVCAALPAGARLRLDANGAWDRRQAERWLERCAGRPVEFVEQPVAADARGAVDVLLGLAADYPVPLALDESLVGEGDVAAWLDRGWPGVFVLKPALMGETRAVLASLARAKAAVVFSSALETLVGARTALQAAFSWSGEPRALGFGVWPLFADPRFNGPAAAPFIRREDVERINPAQLWNALL